MELLRDMLGNGHCFVSKQISVDSIVNETLDFRRDFSLYVRQGGKHFLQVSRDARHAVFAVLDMSLERPILLGREAARSSARDSRLLMAAL
jgi:hypothetical protein